MLYNNTIVCCKLNHRKFLLTLGAAPCYSYVCVMFRLYGRRADSKKLLYFHGTPSRHHIQLKTEISYSYSQEYFQPKISRNHLRKIRIVCLTMFLEKEFGRNSQMAKRAPDKTRPRQVQQHIYFTIFLFFKENKNRRKEVINNLVLEANWQ